MSMTKPRTGPRWALVLSGGGAKGLAHIGVLRALEEAGYPAPSLVAGTSMGSIVGGLYACGMRPAELKRFALEEFDITRYMDSFVFKMSGPVGKVFKAGQILGSLAGKPGIDSGQKLLGLLTDLTGGKTFAETRISFRCNAVDLCSGAERVFDSGPAALAMRASMSFPAFFEPLPLDGGLYADGGLADNMPVKIARRMGFSRILAVDVNSFDAARPEDLDTVPEILYRSLQTCLNRMWTGGAPRAVLTLHANDGASPLDFDKKRALIELGERVVRGNAAQLAAFFSRGPRYWLFCRKGRTG